MKRWLFFLLIALQAPSAPVASGGYVEGTVLRAKSLEPLAGITVSLENVNGSVVAGTSVALRATTDASGHFAIPDIPPDSYHIYTSGSEIRPERRRSPGTDSSARATHHGSGVNSHPPRNHKRQSCRFQRNACQWRDHSSR